MVHRKRNALQAAKLGRKILQLRRSQDLSQREVEQLMGIPRLTLSKYERGTVFPRGQMMRRFAELFGVTVPELVAQVQPAPGQLVEVQAERAGGESPAQRFKRERRSPAVKSRVNGWHPRHESESTVVQVGPVRLEVGDGATRAQIGVVLAALQHLSVEE